MSLRSDLRAHSVRAHDLFFPAAGTKLTEKLLRADLSADVAFAEKALFGAPTDPSGSRVLDLRKATWLDPVALLVVVAALHKRSADQPNIILRFPKDVALRDVIRLWDLDAATQSLTGESVFSFTDPSDPDYSQEPQQSYFPALVRPPGKYSARLRSLVKKHFFGLTTDLVLHQPRDTEIIEKHWQKWDAYEVKHVLDTHLSGAGFEVPRVVIYELLANAIQHSGATHTCTTSVLSGSKRGSPRSHLTIAIWDDGQAIAQTLLQCLESDLPVRVSESDDTDTFHIKDDGGDTGRIRVSYETPDLDWTEPELLLASLFSGISQKAAIRIPNLPRPDLPHTETLTAGSGLHALYRCVINTFGGSVAIRSGEYFLSLRHRPRAKSEFQYQAKLVHRPSTIPFPGNMITVRMPLTPLRSHK